MERRYCPYCMTVLGEEDVCPACGRRPSEYDPGTVYLRPGTVLADKYILGGVLRQDDASITYIGRDLLLHKKVSVKEFFPLGQATRDAARSPKVRGTADITGTIGAFERGRHNFRREAKILAKMEKQSAIVDVQDLFDANETVYLVTELVTGSTLRQRVQASGPMAPGTLFPLLENVFAALEALHAQGLYHRDITPDNIILERENARLINFASARETGAGQTMTLFTASQEGFSAPEQYSGTDQGPWTDVYGLSATIYFCLTGRTPPAAPGRTEKDTLIPMSELDVPVSRVQDQAVTAGMCVRRQDRFQSVAQLYDGIYRGVLPPSPVPATPPAPPAPPAPRRRKGLILALIALAAAAAVVAGLFIAGVLPPKKAAPAAGPAATAAPTATPKPTPAPGSGLAPNLKVFAGAATLSAGEYDAEAIQALMDDSEVSAIVLREGAVASVHRSDFVVKKPLWVESGATLSVGSMQIPKEGLLVLDGELDCQGVIELCGSGVRMAVDHPLSARTAGGMTVLMDHGTNLTMDESLIDETTQNSLFIKPRMEKDIPTAADAQSLAEAVQNGGSVLLTENVTLPEGFVLENATLFVAEGVRVSGALGQKTAQLTVGEGGVLVNHGTVQSNIDMAGGVVYNYGTLHDYQGFVLSGSAVLINMSSLEVRQGALREPARLVNSGQMVCRELSVLGGRLANVGQIEMPRHISSCNLAVRNGGAVYNAGTMHMQQGSFVDNIGWIVNDGLLEIDEGARLESLCAVYNRRDGIIRPAHETLDCYGGAFLDAGHIEAPEGELYPIPLRADLYRVPEAVEVHNGEELLEALNGDMPVCLRGDAVLDQALTLMGQLYVDGGSLSAPSVTVDGGQLVLRDSGLDTGDLTLDNWAGLTMLGEQSRLAFTGALRMQKGSLLYCPDSDLDMSGRSVDILGGSTVVMERGAFTADGAQIKITGALLFPCQTDFSARNLTLALNIGDITCSASCELTNADITIENGAGIVIAGRTGDLRDCTVTTNEGNLVFDSMKVALTGNTEIINNGYIFISGSSRYADTALTAEDTVRIVNNGEMILCGRIPVEGREPEYDDGT